MVPCMSTTGREGDDLQNQSLDKKKERNIERGYEVTMAGCLGGSLNIGILGIDIEGELVMMVHIPITSTSPRVQP